MRQTSTTDYKWNLGLFVKSSPALWTFNTADILTMYVGVHLNKTRSGWGAFSCGRPFYQWVNSHRSSLWTLFEANVRDPRAEYQGTAALARLRLAKMAPVKTAHYPSSDLRQPLSAGEPGDFFLSADFKQWKSGAISAAQPATLPAVGLLCNPFPAPPPGVRCIWMFDVQMRLTAPLSFLFSVMLCSAPLCSVHGVFSPLASLIHSMRAKEGRGGALSPAFRRSQTLLKGERRSQPAEWKKKKRFS